MFHADIKVDTHHYRIGPEPNDFQTRIVLPAQEVPIKTEYSRDEFLKLPVVDIAHESGEATFTVKDVIKFFANKMGAVHLDFKRSGDASDLLYEIWEMKANSDNIPDVVYTMKGISSSLLRCCKEID